VVADVEAVAGVAVEIQVAEIHKMGVVAEVVADAIKNLLKYDG
jgi:ribosomal protein S3